MKPNFTSFSGKKLKYLSRISLGIFFVLSLTLPSDILGEKSKYRKSFNPVAPGDCFTLTAGSNSPATVGGTLNLTATTSTAGTDTYSWTGPNGFTSTQQNPTISGLTAAAAGTYTVKTVRTNAARRDIVTNGAFNGLAFPVFSTGFLSSAYTSAGSVGNATYNLINTNGTGLFDYESSPACGDYTAGTDNSRFVVSGPGLLQGTPVALSLSDMALEAGLSYTVNFYATSIAGTPAPRLVVQLNGTQVLDQTLTQKTSGGCTWTLFTHTFTATAGLTNIDIFDITQNGGGNNFAIDDIELFTNGCIETATTTVVVNTPTFGTTISSPASTCSFASGSSVRTFTGSVAYTANSASDILDIFNGSTLIKSYPLTTATGTVNVSADYPALGSNQISAKLRTTSPSTVGATTVSTAGCAPTCPGTNVVGGKVYKEINNNGTFNAPNEVGYGGVTVRLYDENNTLVGTTTSAADGSYIFDATAAPTTALRVVFTAPSALAAGIVGANNGSNVRFVTKGSCNVDFTVQDDADFCQANPPLITTCFGNGNPLLAGGAGVIESIVSYPYSAANSTPYPTKIAVTGTTGAVWGLGYHKAAKKLFSAAFMKRHAGLGPNGLGGIYISDVVTNTTAPYADLVALGVNLGTVSPARTTLGGNPTLSNIDPDAFDWAGKIGLGGMSYSADGFLWTVNLFEKKLIKINVGAVTPKPSLSAGDVTQYAITPLPAATNGQARPFGVKYKNGKVYVGVVTTNEGAAPGTGATANPNLQAEVLVFDVATSTFGPSAVLSFPLNYKKGKVHTGETYGEYWASWVNSFTGLVAGAKIGNGSYRSYRPQPMLGDIDFTDDGDMIVTLMDRTGHQTGTRNRSTVASDAKLYNGYIGGDILRARKNASGVFIIEANGKVGTTNGSGIGNAQGPGGGEFYNGDLYTTIHLETTQGGMIVVPNSGQVAQNLMDPVTVFSGGTGWNSNANGARAKVYQLYDSNADMARTFGKAAGLGDLEAICNPTPIEIGNRIWKDANNDGIQNANEVGVPNVQVKLFGTGLPAAGITVTTNAQGEYYFTSATGVNASNRFFGIPLVSGGSYELVFPTTIKDAASGSTCKITLKDAGSGADQDAVDSDVDSATGKISFTLGSQTNHTFDVGFTPTPCVLPTFAGSVTPPTCSGQTTQNNGSITLTGITNADKFGVSAGNTYAGTPAYAAATAISGGTAVVQSAIPNTGGNYTIRLFNAADNCFKDTTIYVAPVPCICVKPSFLVSTTAPDCNGTTSANNGSIKIESKTGGDKFGFSAGSTYAGPAYASASTLLFAPATVTSSIPNTGGTFTVRVFNSTNTCFKDTTVTIAPNICFSPKPTLASIAVTPPTCSGTTPQNNGKIQFNGMANATHFNVVKDAVFSGLTFGQATAVTSASMCVKASIDNTGGTYTVRLYNGSPSCFKDTTITMAAVTCGSACITPQFTLSTTPPTCSGSTQNNDGKVTILTLNNSDRVSVAPGASFPASPSIYDYDSVTFDNAFIPSVAKNDIPNVGGVFTVRAFNLLATCFKDTTITFAPVYCCPVMGDLTVPVEVCQSVNFDVTASGLGGFGSAKVKFYSSTTAVTSAAQAYALTSVLGEIPATSSTVTLNGALLPNTLGTYYVVAVISPAPSDVSCRPYLVQTVLIKSCAIPCPTPNCGNANIKR